MPAARSTADRATLARIALDASVSMSTVSKVLNGRPGVSAETRARVDGLLQSHGYRRRGPSGSGPAGGTLIELVLTAFESVWSLAILQGVEKVAAQNGMSVVVTQGGDRHIPGTPWIDGVLSRQPAGVILVLSDLLDEHKKQLRLRGIPFVLVDPSGNPAPDVSSVGAANWAGGMTATRHLLGLGHTRIGIVTGPEDMLCSRARLSGYRAALDEAGIAVDPELIVHGDRFDSDDGRDHAGELLDSAHPPTAIFASSDMQALGVYEAARLRGVRIPERLSVVGFDDLQLAAIVGPPLTTVRQPLSEMAEAATRVILAQRDDPTQEPTHVDLATRLVVRGSTAAPAS